MSSIPETISAARDFPAIETLLQTGVAESFRDRLPRPMIALVIREVVGELKQTLSRRKRPLTGDALMAALRERLTAASRSRIGRVINGTGIVVHTNLGRAPLSDELFDHIKQTVTGYGNIEFNMADGKRGRRGEQCEAMLAELSGAEAGTVVNNCAAALFVMLNSLANRKYVLISRGELVQIGGGFRIPDILKRAGAKLREVGTTNITTARDYEEAIDERTALILKVHKSNFIQSGFTQEVALAPLVAIGRKHDIPVINDLGSGVFVRTADILGYHEPTVQESVRAGADLTSFSGDKMLGGVQAGLIVGRADLVRKVKKNPIFRAARVDKIVFSVVEKLLSVYLDDTYTTDIKLWRVLDTPVETLTARAERVLQQLGEPDGVAVSQTESFVGGGALPEQPLPSAGLVFGEKLHATRLLDRCRMADPPLIGRVENDQFVVDFKTIDEADLPAVVAALREALAAETGC